MLKPTRVLITGPVHSDPGGVANYYNAVLPYLHANPGYDIEYLEIGTRDGATGVGRMIEDQKRVAEHIATRKPHVVHVNPSLNYKSFVRDALFAWSAKRQRIPLVVFFRGWDDSVAIQVERWWRWFFSATLGRADTFIVLAQRMAAQLQSWGIKAPVLVDTTVVDDHALRGFSMEERTASLAARGGLRVLFMARLEPSKGVLETMDAVAELARSGLDISLTVAGDGSAMQAVRERLNADPFAQSRVTVAGYVTGDGKRDLFADHDIYCMPSYYGEGMPNSLVEAMGFGMPIVTCAVGGIGDMFVEGSMGHLVAPRDVKSLCTTLRTLSEDRGALLEMARFNHEYATARLLASGAAGRLLEVYQRLRDQ